MTDSSTYDVLRHFADSWGLVIMLALFILLVGWPFRPGSAERNHQSATMIFDEDDSNG